MAIDDRIDAAKAQIAADERALSPVTEMLAEVMDSIPLLKEIPILKFVERKKQENQKYLLDVLTSEMKKISADIGELDKEHQRFVKEDFIPLVLDGLKKAESTRARQRIEHIGKILAYALEQGPAKSPDDTEEMMRIAMDLDDNDVRVLREIVRVQAALLQSSQSKIAAMDPANDAWRDNPPRLEGISDGTIQSICAKLQSYGLITAVERNAGKVGPNVIPYGLLHKGVDFVTYIRGVCGEKSKSA